MLDFGWVELFLIMVVAVFVIGPDEIPGVMRGLGRIVRRVRYMKYNLSRQIEELIGEDLHDAVNFEAPPPENLPEGHDTFDEAAHDEEEHAPGE